MICVMKTSLKIVWKAKIPFLLNETLLIFFKQKYISLFGTYSLKIPKNLIASAFFFAEADTQKRRYLPTTEANFKRWLVKHADWIIKNDHAIICVLFFCKW